MNKEGILGIILIAVAVVLLILFNRKGLIAHESVGTKIITPEGTVTPDPDTGLPRFDSRIPSTIPREFDSAIAPLAVGTDTAGQFKDTNFPTNPKRATCPIGWALFKDVADGKWWCVQQIDMTDVMF